MEDMQVSVDSGEMLRRLHNGIENCECGFYLSGLNDLKRVKLYESLVLDRMERKCNEVFEVWESVKRDWNQAFYIMLFRTMGVGTHNLVPYEKLARNVPYKYCLKERSSLQSLEALLLGASGLIYEGFYDDYIIVLQKEFLHLQNKYSINTMKSGEWDMYKTYPSSSPTLRIAQLVTLIANPEFIFDNIIECKKCEDIYKLFDVEASEYWTTHYTPHKDVKPSLKRLGETKINNIIINLVIPFAFAYATVMNDEMLKTESLELLNDIPCEQNMVIKSWKAREVKIENSFDSQAILQLNKYYCKESRCAECLLGKMQLNNASKNKL